MLDVDDNILFLTFTYIMMFNMFKFIDFFCKEKGVRFHWNILESLDEFRRKTYVFNYYSYAKTLFPNHISKSKYLQLRQHTMRTENIFFCI